MHSIQEESVEMSVNQGSIIVNRYNGSGDMEDLDT